MRTRVLALCALSLATLTPAVAQDAPARADDEKALRELAASFAHRWNTRDSNGVVGLFDARHGSVRSGQETVRGGVEIARWFKSRPDADMKRLSSTPRGLHVTDNRQASFDLVVEGALPEAKGPLSTVPSWRLMAYRDDPAEPWRVLRLQRGATFVAGPVRVGGEIKEPRKVTHVNPKYPPDALKARIQGVVLLECTISPEGQVGSVDVLRGDPLLVPAAMDAVQQWVYTPTLLNGVAVPVIMSVTVNFRLQ